MHDRKYATQGFKILEDSSNPNEQLADESCGCDKFRTKVFNALAS